MAVLAKKVLELVDKFDEVFTSPNQTRKSIQLIVVNVSPNNDYLSVEIESELGNTPLFFNFPILSYDTYFMPTTISLSTTEKIIAKSTSGGLIISVHEKD